MAKKSVMTPDQLKNAREQLQLTQKELGDALGRTDRFITYRESGHQPIDTMMKFAIGWLLLPPGVREKFSKKFFD